MTEMTREYIDGHMICTDTGGVLIWQCDQVHDAIDRELTNLFGSPTTIGGGEESYWIADDLAEVNQ